MSTTAADIRVGDVGTAFRLTVRDEEGAIVDLSTATLMRLLFRPPKGAARSKPAELVTDGTDGQMRYVTQSPSDLDKAGLWEVQAYVEVPGWRGHSGTYAFDVKRNLA